MAQQVTVMPRLLQNELSLLSQAHLIKLGTFWVERDQFRAIVGLV